MRTFISVTFLIFFVFGSAQKSLAQIKKIADPIGNIGSDLPNFEILLLDGVTTVATQSINNNRPTVFLFISPDCAHCSELSVAITQNIAAFDSINLCLLSAPLPMVDIRFFAEKNKLLDFEQITIGVDIDFFMGRFFNIETVPFVALYNQKNKLVKVVRDIKSVQDLLELINSNQ